MKIILLHGLYMHGVAMIPLEKRLTNAGHAVLNISYSTVMPNLKALFGEMDAFIDGEEAVIVGHSMGGVITRVYLENESEMSKHVKTVITLGTPHKGSKVAAFFKGIGISDFMFQESSRFLLPDYEPTWPEGSTLYSIAGDMRIGPAAVLLRSKESDGTVLIDETKIEGMASHEIFPVTHTALIFAKRVADRIIEILE
ncbi:MULTISPECIES: PGAP1-like alpha/beta domain-containing protein [Grimontia]|uniref:PGAP1-like protein n=1 Tax=Grimontia marina TaxID=646534 RepID=A0A128F895_9GAMM|nr:MULTISPECIES: alpha/beta hydrolase [Grimontia]WRV98107.1 alpha/beta hydrolase [Grimontia sp. NTOU-MAR1]CZF82526.1 PGAP1-like protein [Grimontia marina]